jgi:hypothetical protein
MYLTKRLDVTNSTDFTVYNFVLSGVIGSGNTISILTSSIVDSLRTLHPVTS